MLLQALLSLATASHYPPELPVAPAPVMHHVVVNTSMMPPGEVGFEDYSRADVDGPFVFYRHNKVVVKSVQRPDSVAVKTEQVFKDKKEVGYLVCSVPETKDKFSFKLRDNVDLEIEKYDLPQKMLVISDIEGNFKGFKTLLQGIGVMNDQFQWSFGNGHLVLIGDFFDRGLNVTEVLWLIYKLEGEADLAGGKVHFILGNHEVLNLEGNTQYVRNKYLENADLMDESYINLYAADTELGRWLRTKNAIERIGEFAFCHGGISPELLKSGLSTKKVNDIARRYLGKPYQDIENPDAQVVFDAKTGIFWFRGISKKQVEKGHITAALEWAGAQKLVMGHTLVGDVTAMYGGRVFCVDIYHDENIRQGFMKSMWVENGDCYSINNNAEKTPIYLNTQSKM